MFLFCFILVTCFHCSLTGNYVTKNKGKKYAGEGKERMRKNVFDIKKDISCNHTQILAESVPCHVLLILHTHRHSHSIVSEYRLPQMEIIGNLKRKASCTGRLLISATVIAVVTGTGHNKGPRPPSTTSLA